MGGGDGNLYEVVYTASDSWRGKRCRKVCHTGGLRQLLPFFVSNAFRFGAGSSASLAALVDLVVDEHRNILYARSQGSMIQVYDLGEEGKDGPTRVAEISDFLSEASRASGGREVFGRGAGDKQGASVAFMAPILPHQSRRLQLMTVTVDGRRVYWSCYSSPASNRPDRLRAEIARGLVISRPLSDAASFSLASGRRPLSLSLHVAAACTGPEGGAGTLLLAADALASGGAQNRTSSEKEKERIDATRLVIVTRDLTLPPVGTAIGVHVEVVGLRESVEDAGTLLPGEPCAVAPVSVVSAIDFSGTPRSARVVASDLTSQNAAPRPKFVVLTTAGTVEVERLRPADLLVGLLLRGQRNDLENFFSLYAPQEAAAMCIQIASGDLGGGEGVQLDPSAVVRAESALDEFFTKFQRRLSKENADNYNSQETEIQAYNQNLDLNLNLSLTNANTNTNTSNQVNSNRRERFDMGAVVQAAEPGWSAAHDGLCLYVSRVLGPTWDRPVLTTMSSKHGGLLRCTLNAGELSALEHRLSGLVSFLARFLERRGRRPPVATQWWDVDGDQSQNAETTTQKSLSNAHQVSKRQRLANEKLAAHAKELDHLRLIGGLITRTKDACFLLRTLVQNNLSRASARAAQGENDRFTATGLRFREWVATEDGEAVARKLIAACLSELRPGPAEELTATLRAGCPSFFESSDQTYYAAASLLTTAENATNVGDREEAVMEAVKMLLQVPQACDLEALIPRLLALRAAGQAVDIIAATIGIVGQGEANTKIAALLAALSALTLPTSQTVNRSFSGGQSQLTRELAKVLQERAVSSQEALQMQQQVITRIIASGNDVLRDVAISTLVRINPKGALTGATTTTTAAAVGGGGGGGIQRLDVPPGSVEAVLVRQSGLWDVGGLVNGNDPLDQDQLAHAEVLARHYVQRGQYASAAGVYELLASRPCAPREAPEPTFEQRLMALESAVLQSRSCGEGALIERLEAKLRVAQVQAMLLEETVRAGQGGGSGYQTGGVAAVDHDLGRRLMSLEELYNDVAVPHGKWAACLELLDISSLTAEPAYVAQLWDLLLESAVRGEEGGVGRAFDTVVAVGRRLHQKPESTFPVAHVAMRLEQISTSIWPSGLATENENGTENTDYSRAWKTLLAACSGSFQRVITAYQDLLTEPGAALDATQKGRGRLLRALADLVATGMEEGGAGGKDMDSDLERMLYAACRTFEGEAKRLGQVDIANSLGRMGAELKRRLARW